MLLRCVRLSAIALPTGQCCEKNSAAADKKSRQKIRTDIDSTFSHPAKRTERHG